MAQNVQVDPCTPVIIQLQKAEVGPTPGPTWRLSHAGDHRHSWAWHNPSGTTRLAVVNRWAPWCESSWARRGAALPSAHHAPPRSSYHHTPHRGDKWPMVKGTAHAWTWGLNHHSLNINHSEEELDLNTKRWIWKFRRRILIIFVNILV